MPSVSGVRNDRQPMQVYTSPFNRLMTFALMKSGTMRRAVHFAASSVRYQ